MQRVQERIIESSHRWLSLEEAKEAELNMKWCIVKYYRDSYRGEEISEYQVIKKMEGDIIFENIWLSSDVDNPEYRTIYHNLEEIETESYDIIWLPPCLARVLNALGSEFYCRNWIRHAEKISNNYENRTYICERKLLNEDWTLCHLRDQSEETQKAIALLLGWKDE